MKIQADLVEIDGDRLVIKQYDNGEIVRKVSIDIKDSYVPGYFIEELAKVLKNRAERARLQLESAKGSFT